MSIDENIDTEQNEVVIGENRYTYDGDALDLLGKSVTVYYDKSGDLGIKSASLILENDESKRCLAYTYKNSDGTKTAAFYDRDVKTARSKIYLGCDTVTKIDLFGNEQVIKGNGGYFEIDLSDGVAYLKGDFSALEFCDRYTGGYKTVFSDDFEDYTGGNREFYRGINTASAVNTESGTALCTNNKVESESAVIRKIYIKDCKFGGTDKAKVSFDLSIPQNPDEYLSQTYIRFRNDSAASDAVTAEQKKENMADVCGY